MKATSPSKHEDAPGISVRVTATKPVSFRVGRLREFLKDDTGIVTVRPNPYFLSVLQQKKPLPPDQSIASIS